MTPLAKEIQLTMSLQGTKTQSITYSKLHSLMFVEWLVRSDPIQAIPNSVGYYLGGVASIYQKRMQIEIKSELLRHGFWSLHWLIQFCTRWLIDNCDIRYSFVHDLIANRMRISHKTI